MDPKTWFEPEPIYCQNPAELLTRLEPSSSLWAPFEYGRWAFRGQADAMWDLIPRALRPGEKLSFRDKTIRAPLDYKDQIEAEWNLLADFIELADELGFQLPGDLKEFRHPWKQYESASHFNESWPPASILEIAAIAQHHGVPTRLLDFTFNPFVAAYFAAAHHIQSEYLAVWAVDTNFIQTAWAPFESGVRVVQVSRGSNPFLHAQSGLFIYDAEHPSVPIRERILKRDIRSLNHIDTVVKDHIAQSQRIMCLTIPTSQRQQLLKKLSAMRVTRAHLKPTLDNVVVQLWMDLGGQAADTKEEG